MHLSASCYFYQKICLAVVLVPGAGGEADAQSITALAMWMIEHPSAEDECDESHGRGSTTGGDRPDFSYPGATTSTGDKSAERSSYLCSPGDIASADAAEMEEVFSERCIWKSFLKSC